MNLFKGKRGQTESSESSSVAPTTPYPTRASAGGSGVARKKMGEREIPMANIGKSISIKGDVTGDEDTVIEGRVEGRVELKNHHLTVGPNGDVRGEINAKQCTIVGKVQGNVIATERIEVSESGRIDGDLSSPRLLVQEGAQVNGTIVMTQGAATQQPQPKAQATAKKAEPSKPRIAPQQQAL
ncbi:MAG: polymer-forming cytoskeletal protein [Deltaproteobacteria bacterium]|nr:polymer-forming cytoskeletal protein [Deltaproteobacteria bacterium]